MNGIVLTGETNEQYHSDLDWLSNSMIKKMRSPRLFEAEYILQTMPEVFAKHFDLGTAVHMAALEPELYGESYIVIPPECSDRRTKKYKEWAASAPPHMKRLTVDEAAAVGGCVASLNANPLIRMALQADGLIEESFRWHDVYTDVQCKFRPDKILPDKQIIFDIKTIDTLSQFKFANHVADFGYYLQEAHYCEGAAVRFDTATTQPWVFMYAVVETNMPHRSRLFQLDSDWRTLGLDTRIGLLREYRKRKESGDWSDPNEHELNQIQLTPYLRKRMSD